MPQGSARLFTALCLLVALVAIVLVNQGNASASDIVEIVKGYFARIRLTEREPAHLAVVKLPPRRQAETTEQDTPDTLRTISEPEDKDIPDLGDGQAQLETLGPIVVNTDGTLSRISNWQGMTASERALTLKRLKKRNGERLAKLKGAQLRTDAFA